MQLRERHCFFELLQRGGEVRAWQARRAPIGGDRRASGGFMERSAGFVPAARLGSGSAGPQSCNTWRSMRKPIFASVKEVRAVTLSCEVAAAVPIQIIGDAAIVSAAPASCSWNAALTGPAVPGANGIPGDRRRVVGSGRDGPLCRVDAVIVARWTSRRKIRTASRFDRGHRHVQWRRAVDGARDVHAHRGHADARRHARSAQASSASVAKLASQCSPI